jgi:hypothetical protein
MSVVRSLCVTSMLAFISCLNHVTVVVQVRKKSDSHHSPLVTYGTGKILLCFRDDTRQTRIWSINIWNSKTDTTVLPEHATDTL